MLDPSLLENLDCMTKEDLLAYSNRVRKAVIETSNTEDDYTRILLCKYAQIKADAMESRHAGLIQQALRLETLCETIYKRLPDYAKW